MEDASFVCKLSGDGFDRSSGSHWSFYNIRARISLEDNNDNDLISLKIPEMYL
jgi:hypothetical protein